MALGPPMKLICATPLLSVLNRSMNISRRFTYCEFSAKALTILSVTSCDWAGKESEHADANSASAVKRRYLNEVSFYWEGATESSNAPSLSLPRKRRRDRAEG